MSHQLSRAQKRELYDKMKAGDTEAREKLILSIVPLGWHIAARMAGNREQQDEFRAESLLHVCRAVDFWNPDRGELTTIASTFVMNGIRKLLCDRWKHSIRIPVDACKDAAQKIESGKGKAAAVVLNSDKDQAGDPGNSRNPQDHRARPQVDILALDAIRCLLTEDEWAILIGSQTITLEELASERGLTRERVRQIQFDVLAIAKTLFGVEQEPEDVCPGCGDWKGKKAKYCEYCACKARHANQAARQLEQPADCPVRRKSVSRRRSCARVRPSKPPIPVRAE